MIDVDTSDGPLWEDRRGFAVHIRVSIEAPVLETRHASIEVDLHGTFVSDAEISDELYRDFLQGNPLVLMWPYARSYISDAAAMLAVDLAPLPTLDVLAALQPEVPQIAEGSDVPTQS
jgi:preprotein translocase subunit SecB